VGPGSAVLKETPQPLDILENGPAREGQRELFELVEAAQADPWFLVAVMEEAVNLHSLGVRTAMAHKAACRQVRFRRAGHRATQVARSAGAIGVWSLGHRRRGLLPRVRCLLMCQVVESDAHGAQPLAGVVLKHLSARPETSLRDKSKVHSCVADHRRGLFQQRGDAHHRDGKSCVS
jgi:hypothetical protein